MQWEWYTSTARTRLEPGAAFVIVLTRWHYDDIVGRILDGQDREDRGVEWDVVSIPALSEGEGDALGRPEGAALWPERYPEEDLLDIQTEIGPRDWSALFQQRPTPQGDTMFPLEAWQWYDYEELAASQRFMTIHQFWDTAFKPGEENDFTVGATWFEYRNNAYLLGYYRGRPGYPELQRIIRTEYARWNPRTVWVEDAASGTSIIQSLRRDTNVPRYAVHDL